MTVDAPRQRSGYSHIWLAASALAIAAITLPIVFKGPPLVIWNASASVPIGLYVVRPCAQLQPGDLAVAQLPASVRSLAAERQYLPVGVLLIKPVAATAGAEVCRYARRLFIDERWIADAKAADRRQRPLPQWSGCHRLNGDELFLANPRVADSFDGRYFGPTALELVHGRAWPVLAFGSEPAPILPNPEK